tara:strand:- start:573 stop:962 length:390 start_codon:yes stop_codon:yes gene_type:complete
MVYTSYITIAYGEDEATFELIDNFLLGVFMVEEGYKRDYNACPKVIKRKTIDKLINTINEPLPTPTHYSAINKRFHPKFYWLSKLFYTSKKNDLTPMVHEYVKIITLLKFLRIEALHPAYVRVKYHHAF